MKINVKARTGAKVDRVEAPQAMLIPVNTEWYIVKTKALPIGGKANDAIISLLALHFGVVKSKVVLVRGFSSKQKIFEILQ